MLSWLSTAAVADPVAAQLPAASPTAPFSPADLASLWEGHRAEIATAEIRFRCFNSTLADPQNTPDRVARVLAQHDLSNHPEQFEACLLELNGSPFTKPRPWEDMSLIVSGRRRRFEDAFTTFVSDGEVEAAFAPSNRQVDLFPVGKSAVHHYDLSDIRWTPSARVSAESWEFLSLAGDDAVFRVPPSSGGNGSEIVVSVDTATGIVTHKLTRRAEGTPAIEMYQQSLVLHASGIVFPRLRVDLQDHNGSVRTARVILIESAEFNVPVSDDVFALPIAKGTRVIDYRGSEKNASIAARPEADVLAWPMVHLTSPALLPQRAPAASPPHLPWTLLIAAHLMALVAGGAILWRRRRGMRRH